MTVPGPLNVNVQTFPRLEPGANPVRAQRMRGFTLMEVLVVLILVAIISGLLMQGFTYMLQLQQRFAFYLREQQRQQLQSYWIRSLVAGVTPVPENETYQFSGEDAVLRGMTLTALTAPLGVPRYFELALKQQDEAWQLAYDSGQGKTAVSWVLAEWAGGAGQFSYLDRGGQWHDQWPPKNPTGYQLPVAVRIQIAREAQPLQWIVAITGRRNPRKILFYNQDAEI